MSDGIGLEDRALATEVRQAGDAARRRALLSAVERALRDSGLRESRVDQALAALREGSPDSWMEVVRAVADEYDEVAWHAQERSEIDEAASEAYVTAFQRARAASALAYAFEPDSLVAALEGLYEAFHAVHDPETMLREARAILS